MFKNPITQKISHFLQDIGIEVVPSTIDSETTLPGIKPASGKILVDESRLKYPCDLLHGAGHLACRPEAERREVDNINCADPTEEMMVVAWAYAASVRLGLDPRDVFHDAGYHCRAHELIEGFQSGRAEGISLLQNHNMTAGTRISGGTTYPNMAKWTRN